jgi:hypothetical protein
MATDDPADEEDVTASITIEGEYDEVVDRLSVSGSRQEQLGPPLEDLSTLLETVARIDGGTRSVIAEAMPGDTAADYDAEAVVDALQVLARYDLVVLEGNTWRPGPALQT